MVYLANEMIIQDEHGASWEVAKGDPAWEYVSVLERARFTKKALLMEAIVQGRLPTDAEWTEPYAPALPPCLLALECVHYLRERNLE
jgi:hypothetical protein